MLISKYPKNLNNHFLYYRKILIFKKLKSINHISKCIPLIIYLHFYSKNINYSSKRTLLHLSMFYLNLLLKEWIKLLFPNTILNFKIKPYCWNKLLNSMRKDIINLIKRLYVYQLFISIIKEVLKFNLLIPKIKFLKVYKTW